MGFRFSGLGLKCAFPTTIDPENREPTGSPMYEHLAFGIRGLHAYVHYPLLIGRFVFLAGAGLGVPCLVWERLVQIVPS